MKRLALLAIFVALILVGCSEGGPADPTSSIAEKKYKPIVITYNGKPLRCVERKGDSGVKETSGAYSGLSCDWVAFHLDELQRGATP